MNESLMQIYLMLAMKQFSVDGALIIQNYQEKFDKMPNRAAIWANREGDDLHIYLEPMDDIRISSADIAEMERKARDGKIN